VFICHLKNLPLYRLVTAAPKTVALARCAISALVRVILKKIDDSIDKPFYDRMYARLQTLNREKIRQIRSSAVEPVLGTLVLSCHVQSGVLCQFVLAVSLEYVLVESINALVLCLSV
jgi:hypothetical protein